MSTAAVSALPTALVTVAVAARMLSATPWSTYQLCESGELPSGRLGDRIVIRPQDVHAFAAQVTSQPR